MGGSEQGSENGPQHMDHVPHSVPPGEAGSSAAFGFFPRTHIVRLVSALSMGAELSSDVPARWLVSCAQICYRFLFAE